MPIRPPTVVPVAPRRAGPVDRCPGVLTAAAGHAAAAVADQRPVAITEERAAANGRPPDSWEPVMPFAQQIAGRRLPVAGGLVRRAELRGRS